MTNSLQANPAPAVAADGNVARDRAIELLRRYPGLSEAEIGELVRFYREASALDTALISCDEMAARHSRQFERDHARAISRGLQAPLVVVVIVCCCALIALGFYLQIGAA